MTSLDIDFEWWRDDAGYRLVPAHPPVSTRPAIHPVFGFKVAPSLLDEVEVPARIVRKGGNQIPIRPFNSTSGLYKIFANLAITENGLLEFVHRYGPLTEPGLDAEMARGGGDDVGICRSHAETMNSFLGMADEGRREYVSGFGNRGLDWINLRARLAVSNETGRVQLMLKPPSLLAALWLEFGKALSTDAVTRQCLYCGDWFEAGPGTGRRVDAKFCTDDHRVIFNSRKRSEAHPPKVS